MSATKVDHCFPLNGLPNSPEVEGTINMIQLYKKTLPGISFSGPTYFAPLIQQQLNIINAYQKQKTKKGANKTQPNLYSILLIVTDGEIHDMTQTKDLLVQASQLPLSVIIVGVGKEQFEMMRELDSDGTLLRATNGDLAVRDLVQFVKFEDFPSVEKLSEEVLKEIPA